MGSRRGAWHRRRPVGSFSHITHQGPTVRGAPPPQPRDRPPPADRRAAAHAPGTGRSPGPRRARTTRSGAGTAHAGAAFGSSLTRVTQLGALMAPDRRAAGRAPRSRGDRPAPSVPARRHPVASRSRNSPDGRHTATPPGRSRLRSRARRRPT
jgi:hypothetical protein